MESYEEIICDGTLLFKYIALENVFKRIKSNANGHKIKINKFNEISEKAKDCEVPKNKPWCNWKYAFDVDYEILETGC